MITTIRIPADRLSFFEQMITPRSISSQPPLVKSSAEIDRGYHHFITKRLWEYDPLAYSIQKYWIESVTVAPQSLCRICYEQFTLRTMWSECPNGEEEFCSGCLKDYVIHKIEEGQVLPDHAISCPCSTPSCSGSVKEAVVLRLLADDIPTIDKFTRFSLNAEVSSNNSKTFCPNRQCGSVVTRTSRWTNIVSCQQCQIKFCFNCRESHSALVSCSMSGDLQFKKWRQSTIQGCKRCPKCHIYIEKNEGCMHMTCVSCRHEFCWQCLSSWRGACSAPKPYHNTMKLLNDDIWGQSFSTRMATKSIGLPILCVVGCGVGGLALGAASVAATCFLLSTPIAAGVYVYNNPPRAVRQFYYRMTSRPPDISNDVVRSIVQSGVIISLPWQYDDQSYLNVLQGMRSDTLEMVPDRSSNPTFMGIPGRVSDSIFVGYINHPTLSSFVAYFVPNNCPLEHLNELSLQRQDFLHIAYPSNTIPYSDRREEDTIVLDQIYQRIRLTAAIG